MSRSGDLVFIGDVHLDVGDAELDPFLALLDRLGETASRIVLMGDLFNLWLGRRELQQPHHRAVTGRLAELRRRGVVVRYLEGNRDYRIGDCFVGDALDESSTEGIEERAAGRRLFAVHGDLANVDDRHYRAWRRLSRSGAVWALFNLLPAAARRRLAERVERRMRGTNLAFKREFPEAMIRRYAAAPLAGGFDDVVIGHFHVERRIDSTRPPGTIWVLPEWKGSRRHLRVGPDGTIGFVDAPAGRPG